jgi:putative membrane-bound dehydrogenase-like protein
MIPRASLILLLCLLSLPCLLLRAQRADEPPTKSDSLTLPPDTEGNPLPPAEALKRITVPPGFNVTLFAHEPDIRQPIAMTFDDRARLWVCECYSYPDFKTVKNRDRVVILEDTDHDGRHDRRTIFWDRGNSLTGIEFGYGGIFVSCAPHLLFIHDKNGDDRPDGEPEILLDGWTTKAQHNVFNGLKWGPDGWLYGCHGITATSRVGRPGTPDDKRVTLNCCIWRYHPTRKTFEVVAHGTTNPWGIDFNEYGEGFFTNCVIDHAFHLIPGAHYKRMFGQDLNPYVYELMDAASDHRHWGEGHWTESRKGDQHDSPGGGHAHSGTLIYLGDNFPKEYYGTLFTCNIHGHRVNNDSLERKGSGWVAKHRPDFFKANDPFFRGVALAMGPDGGMYIADWSDTGECHDYEQVHRHSGRIYKVVYGEAKPFERNLAQASVAELAALQKSANENVASHARRLLIEQAKDRRRVKEISNALVEALPTEDDTVNRLRYLFALHATKSLEQAPLWISFTQPEISPLLIRLLCGEHDRESKLLQKVSKSWLLDAAKSKDAATLLALCSVLHRFSDEDRWSLVEELANGGSFEEDANLPLMVWYGIEPCVRQDPKRALKLAVNSKLTKPRKYIVRRLCEPDLRKENLAAVVAAIASTSDAAVQLSMLAGMSEAFAGLKNQPLPKGWDQLAAKLANNDNQEIKKLVRTLSLIFGDPSALQELESTLQNESAKTSDRIAAIELLSERKTDGLVPQLTKLLDHQPLRLAALRGLSAYDDASTPSEILKRYNSWDEADRIEAINTLASRPSYANILLDALESKQIPREDVSPFHARQLAALKNRDINNRLAKVWGRANPSTGDKLRRKDEIKATLPDEVVAQADVRAGRAVFSRMCGQCHSLFGEGAKIGPELTGAQRANLDYVLENLIDPNAIVSHNYQMTVATLDDGRVVSGVIESQNDATVTLKTTSGKSTLARGEIDELQTSPVSMMPEGQLEKLSFDQLRDLVAYLRSPRQVPLP